MELYYDEDGDEAVVLTHIMHPSTDRTLGLVTSEALFEYAKNFLSELAGGMNLGEMLATYLTLDAMDKSLPGYQKGYLVIVDDGETPDFLVMICPLVVVSDAQSFDGTKKICLTHHEDAYSALADALGADLDDWVRAKIAEGKAVVMVRNDTSGRLM